MEVAEQKKVMVPKLRFSEFSESWEEKRLENACTFHDSARIPIKEGDRANRRGPFPYYGASGIIDWIDDFTLDGEYVLFAEDGWNILLRSSRLAFVVKGKFWVNNHAHVIQAHGSNFFLAEVLERIDYKLYNTGTRQPKLNAQVCKGIRVILPKAPEQQKIAAFLSAVDEKLQHLNRKKELLQQYKKGVMQKLFSQELRFKREDGSDYEDWEEKRLGEIGEFKTSSVDKKIEAGEKLVRLVNYMNVYRHENIRLENVDELMEVSANRTQLETSDLKRGDILFTPSSETPDDIGHSVVMFEDLPNVLYSYHLMRFRPKVELDLMYSHYFCNVPQVLAQISRFATGSTRFTISVGNFSDVRVSLPCFQEQQKIAAFLSSLDEKIEAVSAQIEMTQQFKKGLLQEMFV